MTQNSKTALVLFALLGVSTTAFAGESTTIKVKGTMDDEGSITIRKGSAPSDAPDYEMISGDEAVYGDPVLGQVESYASWKEACADWKQEVKELNKGSQIVVLNCNRPVSTSEKNGLVTHHSRGTYKIRAPLKKSHKAPTESTPTPAPMNAPVAAPPSAPPLLPPPPINLETPAPQSVNPAPLPSSAP